jgi:hypothetical protein
MHKAHNMSHAKITIQITVKYSAWPGHLRAASPKDLENSEAAEFSFIQHISLPASGLSDPWQLRNEFLSWPPDGWKGFIAKAGNFGFSRISKEKFEQWQKLVREALARPAREWKALDFMLQIPGASIQLSRQPRIAFSWEGDTPQAIITARTALEAIVATIQIDKLTGAEFRVCARHDCKNPPFRVEARQKIFCSSDCAHLVAVRKSRERAAEAKSKATKKAPNRKHRRQEKP